MRKPDEQRVFKWQFSPLRNPDAWHALPVSLHVPAPIEESGPDDLAERQSHIQSATGRSWVPRAYGRPLSEEEISFYPNSIVFIRKELKQSDLRRHAVRTSVPIISSHVVEIIEAVEKGVHQFIPVDFVVDDGSHPFKHAPFFFFHCCNNIAPDDIFDWESLQSRPGNLLTDRFGDEFPAQSGLLRVASGFQTSLKLYTINRYRTRSDPDGTKLKKLNDTGIYCSLEFVRAVYDKHPYKGKIDFNDFEEVRGGAPASVWEWR